MWSLWIYAALAGTHVNKNGIVVEVPDPPPGEDVAAPTVPLGHVRGRVVEMGSGLPIEGTATCDGLAVELDAEGAFRCDLPAGVHHLTAEGPEHRLAAFDETLGAGQTVEVVYRLERYSWNKEIVVYGEPVREEVSRSTYTAEELRRVPGAFGDPIRAVHSLPSVARQNGLDGGVVVRGAEALNTAVYIDEVPVPYLFHFFLGRSVVSPAVIDDVEFYPGGMPTRFGDSTQAVVNARTLDTSPEKGLHGRVSADLMDFGVSSEGRIGKHFTWQGAYRVSWIGPIIGLGARIYAMSRGLTGYRPAYPTISYTDYLARVAWEDGPNRLVFTALGSQDNLKFHPVREDDDGDGRLDPLETNTLPYDPNRLMNTGFHRFHLRWDRKEGGREQTTWLAIGPDAVGSLFEGIGTLTDSVEMGQLHGFSVIARREDRFPLRDGSALRTGMNFLFQPVKVESYRSYDPQTKLLPTTHDARTTIAAFGEWQRSFGPLYVAPGFRGSAHGFNAMASFEPEPRLTTRIRLHPNWSVNAFIGRFSQIPPAERYADGIGNPDLKQITAWQATLGVEGRYPSGLEIDASIYASRSANLVVRDFRIEVEPPAYQPWGPQNAPETAYLNIIPTYKPVVGYAYGFEAMVRMRPNSWWFGWANVTVGRAIRVEDDGSVHPGSYDLPFSFTLVGAAELPKSWRISTRARVTAGYPYTPIHGVYNVNWEYWDGVTGETNSERFGWFHQVDLRVDKTWTGKRARWTFYADGMNVTNAKNWLLAGYNPNYTKLEKQIYLPIIPNFGVEVSY